MNHTKLVGIIKSVITEARKVQSMHHGMRYSHGSKKLAGAPLHVPDRAPQLAEKKKEKVKPGLMPGKTDTGQMANKIITEPAYNSQMTAASGPKPQTDTK